MKFDYKVKYKGKWYLPGEEIPEDNEPEVKEEVVLTNDYTKTEINRMSTADLQKLAAEHGVSGAEEIRGAELKKILIEKFGL
ncbi:unknown [Clostridium sp. CAG:510]|nr:unknown [Clostridium sp. CAG:510]